jgi:hypothetical protein
MHATAGELTHLLHRVAIPGIDDVGGAKLRRELEFRRIGVVSEVINLESSDVGAADRETMP